MSLTICIVATKGGVGKTTLTANLGAFLAELGQSVLLVDCDPQPTLSSYFPLRDQAPGGIRRLMVEATIDGVVSQTILPGLDLIYSDDPEGTLRDWIRDAVDGRVRLKHLLARFDAQYDFILIDTQGAIGPLQDASVAAADLLVSPIPPEILSAREFARGTVAMLERLKPLSTMGAPIGSLRGVIYKVDRTRDAQLIINQLRSESYLPSKGAISILETVIPDAVAYRESATFKQPVHRLGARRTKPTPMDTFAALTLELFPHLKDAVAALEQAMTDNGRAAP